jgi:hypothetical protein
MSLSCFFYNFGFEDLGGVSQLYSGHTFGNIIPECHAPLYIPPIKFRNYILVS